MRGKFWVFEGMDGAGKSTQAKLLFDFLEGEGRRPIHVREPGTTALGEALRKMLLSADRDDWHQRSEALLFFAARNELLRQQIVPALEAGRDVICDRFTPSTVAYQAKDNADFEFVMKVHDAVVDELASPDGILIFDCEPELSFERVAANSANDGFEKRGIEFQRLVRERYLSFSESCESPCLVVDCNSRGVAEIHEQVATWVMDR